MPILSNDLIGAGYKAIVNGFEYIDISKDGLLRINLNVFIYCSKRERLNCCLHSMVPDSLPLNEIKDKILDDIILYCKGLGWPINRTDILFL